MWPFKKTARQRRVEVRRPVRAGQSPWVRFRQAGGLGALVAAAVLYLAAAAMDLYPLQPLGYRLNQYLPRDIHARVAFHIPMPDLIDQAADRARQASPAIFQLDPDVIDEAVSALRALPGRAAPTTQPADANHADPWLTIARDPNAAKAYDEQIAQLAAAMPDVYLVRLRDPQEHKRRYGWPESTLLRSGDRELARTVGQVLELDDADGIADEVDRLTEAFALPLRPALRDQLLAMLSSRPIYRYDAPATQDLIDRVVAAVQLNPPDEAYRQYAQGEQIAEASRNGAAREQRIEGLAPKQLEVLRAEHEAFVDREARTTWRFWGRLAGRAGLLAIVVGLLAFSVVRYQPQLAREHLRMISLLIVLAGMLAINKMLVGVLHLKPHVAVLPAMMIGAILTITWNQRFALAVGTAMAILLVLQVRGPLELLLVLLAALAAGVLQLDDIRTRTKVIRVGVLGAGVVFLAVIIAGLATAVPWRFVLVDAVWAAGCAAGMGFVVQGILPLIERVFHTATSLTLLEWCDASKPLLRRLAMEAPGTYNHSLQLGAMGEAAAEAIGARGLLARVGAYYHDIGKINKPDYFIENQAGSPSRHDKLSPAMSLLIIIGHVKDGVEMAREYSLPQVLHEFIATHHGTTLVQYFYHAATEQHKSDTDRAPDETEFRYPGPKPHSKESAILMLADAAESSVRAMSEPTPGRIESQVNTMVNRRLMDGQLNECELTLKQVHDIESSLIKSLCSIYHSRISYPTPAGEKPAAAEEQPKPDREEPNQVPAEAPGDNAPDS